MSTRSSENRYKVEYDEKDAAEIIGFVMENPAQQRMRVNIASDGCYKNTAKMNKEALSYLLKKGNRIGVEVIVIGGNYYALSVVLLPPTALSFSSPPTPPRLAVPAETIPRAPVQPQVIAPIELDDSPSPVRRMVRRDMILRGNYRINAGQYVYFRFIIPDGFTGELRGSFAGGGGNGDVDFYVVDYQGFEDYANRKQFAYYISENRATTKRFSGVLAANEYYIIFSNGFSILTDKIVNANVELITFK